ncbi:MAG: PAS domain-containing sensor histidine kinase [Candidatus Stygibacter frigidus]|nr:PAS domain-containing sensor histidine kinase [Candidatus Stygibacter frigidus]
MEIEQSHQQYIQRRSIYLDERYIKKILRKTGLEVFEIVNVNSNNEPENKQSENMKTTASEQKTLQDIYDLVDYTIEEEGFVTVDCDENITYINNTLCQQLGFKQLDLIGSSFNKLTIEKEFNRIKEITGIRQDGRASSYQLILITKSGVQRVYRVSAAPLYIDDRFLGTLGIFSDITEEKEDIKNLATSVQYHELMVKNLPLGSLILDSDGNIITMNPAFTRITGIKPDNLLNQPVLKIKFLSSLRYRYAIDNLLLYQVEFDLETDDIIQRNEHLYLRIRGYHLSTQSSKSYFFLVFDDITTRKIQQNEVKKKMDDLLILEKHLQETVTAKEKELQEKEWQLLEKAKQETNRELLAKIAHYWRQPLNNSTVLIQSLQDDYDFGELNEVRFNKKVNDAVNQLLQLSNTLETFRYLSNSDMVKQDFGLADVIDKAMNLLMPSCHSAGITVKTNLDENILVAGYPRRFAQAIVNVMENAIEALVERDTYEPRISISIAYADDVAEIIIGDNAGGIEADIATRIFEPYVTTKDKEYQGLGLYMARNVITEMLKGDIRYMRTIAGSDFIINLPAKLKEQN